MFYKDLTETRFNKYKRFIFPVFIISMIIVAGICYESFIKQLLPTKAVRLTFSRILLIVSFAVFALTVFYKRQQTLLVIKNYFSTKAHPINLALFRIVLFGCFLILNQNIYQQALWFNQLPKDLMFAPHGMGWMRAFLPLPDGIVVLLISVYYFSCITAFIGLYTRTSAFFVAVLGIYVFGFPGFFGHVYYNHHLIWFSLLLAFSRCSDVLSCDAIIAAWKRKDREEIFSPGEDICYALPLRFIWILIGIIYFFPGFWKIWTSGLDWALSDNVKYIVHLVTYDRTPALNLDVLPFLYRYGALLSVLFELSFIFVIFSNTYRYVAVAALLIFHAIGNLFLDITFAKLYICYVVFFDWHSIIQRIRNWIYKRSGNDVLPKMMPKTGQLDTHCTALALVFAAILAGSIIYGAGIVPHVASVGPNGWPFTVYPMFSHQLSTYSDKNKYEIIMVNSKGQRIFVSEMEIAQKFSHFQDIVKKRSNFRYQRLFTKLMNIQDNEKQKRSFRALWKVFVNNDPKLSDAIFVQFFVSKMSTDPDKKFYKPRFRKLICELKL